MARRHRRWPLRAPPPPPDGGGRRAAAAGGGADPAALRAAPAPHACARAPDGCLPACLLPVQPDVVTRYKAAAKITNGARGRRPQRHACGAAVCQAALLARRRTSCVGWPCAPQPARGCAARRAAPSRTYAHAARAPRLTPPPRPPPHPALPAAALAAVVEACKAGAKVVDLCEKGDSLLNE